MLWQKVHLAHSMGQVQQEINQGQEESVILQRVARNLHHLKSKSERRGKYCLSSSFTVNLYIITKIFYYISSPRLQIFIQAHMYTPL